MHLKKLVRDRFSPRSLALATLVAMSPGVVFAAAQLTERYPFDPACPWGRISNGKGMIHRCLSETEAKALFKIKQTEEKAEPAPEKSLPPAELKEYDLVIGPISSDDGDITIGALEKPLDRYRACVSENGGLQAKKGEVTIEFLVRAERGRAEGVNVKNASGVSQKAAQCIADVVDRRKVGSVSREMMAARLKFFLNAK